MNDVTDDERWGQLALIIGDAFDIKQAKTWLKIFHPRVYNLVVWEGLAQLDLGGEVADRARQVGSPMSKFIGSLAALRPERESALLALAARFGVALDVPELTYVQQLKVSRFAAVGPWLAIVGGVAVAVSIIIVASRYNPAPVVDGALYVEGGAATTSPVSSSKDVPQTVVDAAFSNQTTESVDAGVKLDGGKLTKSAVTALPSSETHGGGPIPQLDGGKRDPCGNGKMVRLRTRLGLKTNQSCDVVTSPVRGMWSVQVYTNGEADGAPRPVSADDCDLAGGGQSCAAP